MQWPLMCCLAAALLISGCTTRKESSPPRTADEQLLIATAAERSAAQITLPIPQGSNVYVDASNFEGVDAKHAIAAIRARMLELGGRLVPDRASADIIVEISAAALSADEDGMLIGLPSMSLPVPLSPTATTPEIALLKRQEKLGVAKLVATSYGVRAGIIPLTTDTKLGYAYQHRWVALLFISWSHDDFLPPGPDDDSLP